MSDRPTSIGAIWREVAKRFEPISASAGLDARILVGHVLKLSDVQMACNEHAQVLKRQLVEIENVASRRLQGEPVARIVGHKEFYGLEFSLNEATLIPRPETELLVDVALEFLRKKPVSQFLELGVGTGCIGISILSQLAGVQGVGVDLSASALDVARMNGERHGVAERMQWRSGSWFDPVLSDEKFDLIISNPPYIVTDVIEGLESGVKDFEPELALDGGFDGLDAYREILSGASERLFCEGRLILEIGYDQGASVMELCQLAGFSQVKLFNDLSGHARVVEGVKRGEN